MMSVYRINSCVIWGAVLSVVGAILVLVWPMLFHSQVRRMMILVNGSTSFGIWQEIPIPMYLECYLYNLSNVDDILAGRKVKPRFQQMGPYVFREKQTKVNIVWNANSTVSYQTRRFWHFNPDRSNGSLSDIITNINPIIPTIAYVLRDQSVLLRLLVDVIARMYHKNMFMTANASSWLFDGISDPILDMSNKIPNFPYSIPFDKFGWLYTRNGSSDYDGWFVVNTGATEFSRLGRVERWNHVAQTVYRGRCGEVRGSTGELWAPVPDQPEISIFASDICTTLTLAASGPVTVLGIEGMLFSSNDSFFDNGQKYSSKQFEPVGGAAVDVSPKVLKWYEVRQSCYCESPGDCMVSGAMNVSACRYGAPAFVTLPHFHNTDPYYANKVDGFEPSDADNFKMAIEMVTGMPLMVHAQLQVNILVRHSQGLGINNQLPDPDILVPMFWFREQVIVDDVYSNFARIALQVYYGMPMAFYVVMIVGIVVLSIGLWTTKCRILRRQSVLLEAQKFLK